MSVLPQQPFIYGRPVRGEEFVNRQAELRTIFNRLRNGESTAVVGESHIGKSSLLFQLANPPIQQAYLDDDARSLIVSSLDLHPISNDYTPRAFWKEALEPLHERLDKTPGERLLRQAAQSGYDRRSLERLFNHLGNERHQRLVLLLDEFERLLSHPNFKDPAFFALLRSLATRTGGLALIIAGRLSVADMNERGRGLLDTGSPFFNNVIELRLRPFDSASIESLLERAASTLSIDDRRFIRRVAGPHPFLLQGMAATLLETAGDNRHARAAEEYYARTSFHFDDRWNSLNDHSRTTAVVLSLAELSGRALGSEFAFGEIERVEAFGPELQKLAERGLAEQVGEGWHFDSDHLLLWQGERWTVGAQAFAWWVRDVVIGGARSVPSYTDWLVNKRYRFLLTEEMWGKLTNTVRNAPDWAIRGVGGLARALFEELTKRRP